MPVFDEEFECSSGVINCSGAWTVEVTTTLPSGTVLDRGECDEVCKSVMCRSWRKGCFVNPTERDGSTTVTCSTFADVPPCVTPGRPVPEWQHEARACSTAAQFFAAMARAEAESVAEFERLALELELHGAPESLIARARTAAEEERRHTRVSAQLAQSPAPSIPAPPESLRSLQKLAEANLLEGCINETMSAVLVASQAEHAGSETVRHELSSIAREELSHAEFSWDLHEWLVSRLDAVARHELAFAGTARVAQTIRHAVQHLPEDARIEAGLPDEALARHQAQLLATELWSPALAALC